MSGVQDGFADEKGGEDKQLPNFSRPRVLVLGMNEEMAAHAGHSGAASAEAMPIVSIWLARPVRLNG